MRKVWFLKNFLPITLTVLLLLLMSTSYYRFIVLSDYLVSYEVECDPERSSCFIGCEDDECTTQYYYFLVERHAAEIRDMCGDSIVDCEPAQNCNNGSGICAITYCDPEIDGTEACTLISEDV